MADEPNDQSDTSLPQPIIDKSSFPGSVAPMAADVPSDEDNDSQTIDTQASLDDNANQAQSMPETASIDTPEIADDNDLIEKEWVNKAKNIIEKTKTDPHEQSDSMTLFKADYIKKRYNKTIKTSE